MLNPALARAPAVDGRRRRWANAGCTSTTARGTGVVLHMLSCLAVDGRFGMTAIGRDPAQASELFDATRAAVEASV